MIARLKPSRHGDRRTIARTLIGAALVVSLVSASAFAQRRFFDGFGATRGNFKPYPNTPYDGRFNFVRVVYECDSSGYWYRGLPSWAHGYPMAERNLMKIMNEVSFFGAQETINTVTYPHSYVWAVSSTYDASTFAWSLYGKCTSFQGVLGYSNESDHDARAETIISVDRRPSLYDDTSTFGESASLMRKINDAQRLRFESKWIDGDGGYTLGNARIRCAW